MNYGKRKQQVGKVRQEDNCGRESQEEHSEDDPLWSLCHYNQGKRIFGKLAIAVFLQTAFGNGRLTKRKQFHQDDPRDKTICNQFCGQISGGYRKAFFQTGSFGRG